MGHSSGRSADSWLAVEERLGLLDRRNSRKPRRARQHGNMSSPTVLFILQRLREQMRGGPAWRWALGRDCLPRRRCLFNRGIDDYECANVRQHSRPATDVRFFQAEFPPHWRAAPQLVPW